MKSLSERVTKAKSALQEVLDNYPTECDWEDNLMEAIGLVEMVEHELQEHGY